MGGKLSGVIVSFFTALIMCFLFVLPILYATSLAPVLIQLPASIQPYVENLPPTTNIDAKKAEQQSGSIGTLWLLLLPLSCPSLFGGGIFELFIPLQMSILPFSFIIHIPQIGLYISIIWCISAFLGGIASSRPRAGASAAATTINITCLLCSLVSVYTGLIPLPPPGGFLTPEQFQILQNNPLGWAGVFIGLLASTLTSYAGSLPPSLTFISLFLVFYFIGGAFMYQFYMGIIGAIGGYIGKSYFRRVGAII